MRNWMTASDEWLSPQAAVLSPDATIRIAAAIVAADTPYHRVIAAGRAAVEVLKDGVAQQKLHLTGKEQQWLTRIDEARCAHSRRAKRRLSSSWNRNMAASTTKRVMACS